MGHLSNGFEVVVHKMNPVKRKERHHLDFFSISCFHLERSVKSQLDSFLGESPANFIPREGDGFIVPFVPRHKITEFLILLIFQPLILITWTLFRKTVPIVGENLLSPEAF